MCSSDLTRHGAHGAKFAPVGLSVEGDVMAVRRDAGKVGTESARNESLVGRQAVAFNLQTTRRRPDPKPIEQPLLDFTVGAKYAPEAAPQPAVQRFADRPPIERPSTQELGHALIRTPRSRGRHPL